MSDTPLWFLIIQVVTTITLVATFVAFLFQLRAMQKQIEVTRQSTMAQNTLTVAQLLFDPELSAGRGHMFDKLAGEPLRNWTDEDRVRAHRVCSSYDIVGLLVMAGIVDRDVIVRHWGQTLKRLYPVAVPLIAHMRETSKDGNYWQALEWLVKQVDLNIVAKSQATQ